MESVLMRAPVRVNPVITHPQELRFSLDGQWRFRLDPKDVGLRERWYEQVQAAPDRIAVPGCWQAQGFGSSASEYNKEFGTELDIRIFKATSTDAGWYAKTFRLPEQMMGKRVFLNFGGVSPTARVWLNGQLLGENHMPLIPFGFDISDRVLPDADNHVVLRVSEEDRPLSLTYSLFGNWSGIYRGVELTAAGANGLDQVRILPDTETGIVTLRVRLLEASSPGTELAVGVRGADGRQAFEGTFTLRDADGEGFHNLSVPVENRRLWSPDDPFLYRFDLTLSVDGQVADAGAYRSGFCALSARGKHICVNGDPYFIRASGDFHENIVEGIPDPSRESWRRKLGMLRAYGYNSVRCQSFLPNEEYMDAADELGLIVQAEMGTLGPISGHTTMNAYAWPQPTADYCRPLLEQWMLGVLRDCNRPSANLYNMSNELAANLNTTTYKNYAWKCYRETKKLKPGCLIIWTDGGFNESLPSDFVNDQAEVDEKTDKPVIQHEYQWWSSYPDHRDIGRYDGLRPYGIQLAFNSALRHGYAHRLDDIVPVTQQLQYAEMKGKMERCRRDHPRLAGISHFNAMDTVPSPQGVLTVDYRKKYIEPEQWLQTNGDTVVLSRLEFDQRVLTPGQEFTTELLVSDFAHPAYEKPLLHWSLVAQGRTLAEGDLSYVHTPYCACSAGTIRLTVPDTGVPVPAELRVELREGARSVRNRWSLWILPDRTAGELMGGMRVSSNGIVDWVRKYAPGSAGASVRLGDRMTAEDESFVSSGGRMILAAGEGLVRAFQFKWSFASSGSAYYFSNAACYPTFEDGQHGMLVTPHGMLGDFPTTQFADLQYFRMVDSPPIDLEPLGLADEDPVLRMIHTYQVGRPLGALLARSLGKGIVVLTSLNLNPDYAEARYLLSGLLRYLCGADPASLRPLPEKALEQIRYAASFVE